MKTFGDYKNKKSEWIRTASFNANKQWERPVQSSWWKHTKQFQPNHFFPIGRLDSLLQSLPHVDRIGLWNRLGDLLNKVENEAAVILESFSYLYCLTCMSVVFGISSWFIGRTHNRKHSCRQTVCLVVIVTNRAVAIVSELSVCCWPACMLISTGVLSLCHQCCHNSAS